MQTNASVIFYTTPEKLFEMFKIDDGRCPTTNFPIHLLLLSSNLTGVMRVTGIGLLSKLDIKTY
jgi:hypothetical protein